MYVVESMIPQFIDKAFMQGLTSVRIIHGVGSGALRQAVRDILSREPHVDTHFILRLRTRVLMG